MSVPPKFPRISRPEKPSRAPREVIPFPKSSALFPTAPGTATKASKKVPADKRPVIAITMGDPAGIGAEVILKALADPQIASLARYRILGLERTFLKEARLNKIALRLPTCGHHETPPDVPIALIDYSKWFQAKSYDFPPRPDAPGGLLSFKFVADALTMAGYPPPASNSRLVVPHDRAPHSVDAIVTGPISKEAWAMAGETRFPGHTELFAAAAGIQNFAMMFVSPRLKVILVTAHIPLANVARAVQVVGKRDILRIIELGDAACKKIEGKRPRIAVCGLNPHAGEGGHIGREDQRFIEPAIKAAKDKGIHAFGPFPADTIFNAALAGKYDLVVAMYHDQGLIPLKLLARDEAVNITVGLPIIRTSPDHGTAYDIAGKGLADPGSMKAAIRLAARLAMRKMRGHAVCH